MDALETHRDWLDARVEALRGASASAREAWPQHPEFERILRASLIVSDYAFEQWRRRPALLGQLAGALDADAPREADVAGIVEGAPGDLGVRLRRYRHLHSLRLIARDACGVASVESTLSETSRLAEVCLDAALAGVEAASPPRREALQGRDGQPLRLAVIGMGKLGGDELNFSSDIDLIFTCADPAAQADDAESVLARIGQRVINLLSANEADGFVHRVDMRLRPFGSVGRLVLPQSAMEQYYQREGRDWERYAWVKARAVAGDRMAGTRVIAALRPFVFRRYLDYAAIDSLREMKGLIDAEVARADRHDDLKLGPGGIREIEFLVQLTQLTRGGREPTLAVPGLLRALAAARGLGAMPESMAVMLADSYRLLRKVENRVQMLRDEQTHRVPDDPVLRERLALGLGHADYSGLSSVLEDARQRVANAFADALVPSRNLRRAPMDAQLAQAQLLWQESLSGAGDGAGNAAAALGLHSDTLDALVALAGNAALRALPERHRVRRDRLLPALIAAATARDDGHVALPRLLALVRAISGRPSYIALLDEQPGARERVIDVFARSGFLAAQVIAHPLLLDDLLDERQREHAVSTDGTKALQAPLATQGEATDIEPEEQLTTLHEFKLGHQFQLGLGWLARKHSADATASMLAGLAESLVGAAHELAHRDALAQHGALAASTRDGLLTVGYGSLGAAELGFASDLDLVFVYDTAMSSENTVGERSVDGARWFARRVQRAVHWLTTPARAGALYPVDVRLRPDGGKGLLVSGFEGFAEYQRERAWTWEQQALVRARPVAGDPELCARFAELRRARLCAPRDAGEVRAEVASMRLRWRRELDRSDAACFDLKQGAGGLVDLEFLLQYLVLAHAARSPALAGSTRTRELLVLAAGADLFDGVAVAALGAAHEALLAAGLDCTLDLRARRVPRSPVMDAAAATIRAAAAAHGLELPG